MTQVRFRLLVADVLTILAIVAALVAVPVITAEKAEAAVSSSCKRNSKVVYNNLTGRVTTSGGSPTYSAKSWFRGCPEKSGLRVWQVGVAHVFPKGSNPKKLGYTGTKVTVRFYPGGSSRTVIAGATSSRSVSKSVAVNVFVPKMLVPPQPHLSRLVTWDSKLSSMWGSGRKDYSKRQRNSMRY